MPDEERYTIDVQERPELSRFLRFGVEVQDISINKRYPAGTVLECVSAGDFPGDRLADGDCVIVEFWREGRVELVVRVLRARGDEWWLWPDSDDPEHQTPRYWRTRGKVQLAERAAAAFAPAPGTLSVAAQHPDGMFVTAVVIGEHKMTPAGSRLAPRRH